jgi:hypothetical protein
METANIMVADYERTRQIQHRGSKGSVREALALEQFFKKYIPNNVAVHGSGEICSVKGQLSTQCDLIVTDPTSPFLLEKDDYRIAAAESVFGVIEVKSNLTAAELKASYRKIAAIKGIPKTAYLPSLGPQRTRKVYGREWTHMPTVGMIFGYEGAELQTLGDAMAEVAAEFEHEPHQHVDSVWILGRGSLTWADPLTHSIRPSPNPGDALQAIASTPGEVLLQLAAHLNEQFATAWTTGLRFRDYIGSAPFGQHVSAWVPSDEQVGTTQRDRISD